MSITVTLRGLSNRIAQIRAARLVEQALRVTPSRPLPTADVAISEPSR